MVPWFYERRCESGRKHDKEQEERRTRKKKEKIHSYFSDLENKFEEPHRGKIEVQMYYFPDGSCALGKGRER